MNVLDLFSGIGGFSLGLERAGMRTVAFCEIDPYCRAVLKKHWPHAPCYEDVRELTKSRLDADGIPVDLICGGFPCQDISNAGRRAGIEGERSGLWSEYARIIGEVRPRYVVVENVAALLGRGLSRVLGDLAALGFDAEWHCIPASAIGAHHIRDRLWIIANANKIASGQQHAPEETRPHLPGSLSDVPHASGEGLEGHGRPIRSEAKVPVAHVNGEARLVAHATEIRQARLHRLLANQLHGELRGRDSFAGRYWADQPSIRRVAHGVPNFVDRIGSCGNAVVPQIPELIGRAIMQAEGLA